MNIFEQILPGAKIDPNNPQGTMPGQPQQASPAQQKLAGMIAQKEKEAAGLKTQQISLKQKELDKEKAQMAMQAKSAMAKPDQQTQGIGGGKMYMKNDKFKEIKGSKSEERYVDYDKDTGDWGIFGTESGKMYASFSSEKEAEKHLKGKSVGESIHSIKKNELKLIDSYAKTLKMAEKTLAEQESMSQRQIQPEQYQNDPEDMSDTDDTSAVKNKTILKHLGHEVGKDDQVHRAERIISKFEKIIPKLKQAIQTIHHRLMQNEYGQQTSMNMADNERAEISDKERRRQLAAGMRK